MLKQHVPDTVRDVRISVSQRWMTVFPSAIILRCSMYQFGYGDREKALELFSTLPPHVRPHAWSTDFSPAEDRCPHKIEIGRVVKTAIDALT